MWGYIVGGYILSKLLGDGDEKDGDGDGDGEEDEDEEDDEDETPADRASRQFGRTVQRLNLTPVKRPEDDEDDE